MPWVSQESRKLYRKNGNKKIGKMTPLTVKNGIFKKIKSLQFPMISYESGAQSFGL